MDKLLTMGEKELNRLKVCSDKFFCKFSAQIKVTIKKLKRSQDRFEEKNNEKTNPFYLYHPQSFARFM